MVTYRRKHSGNLLRFFPNPIQGCFGNLGIFICGVAITIYPTTASTAATGMCVGDGT